MKPDQMYHALCELAEKLDIEVSEQNFQASGIKANSGLCRIKGKAFYLMDKHKPIKRKIKLLAAELARQPLEDIYIVPAVRELLSKYRPAAVEKGMPAQNQDADQPAGAPET